MGLGDYVHWTAVIRDLYKYINSGTIDDKIRKINEFNIGNKKYGVKEYKKEDDTKDFKFFVYVTNANCPLFKQNEAKQVFYNNPYFIKSPAKYPNVIMFLIVSSDYFILREKRFLDHEHVVEQYCKNLGLKDFETHGDIHFTQDEIEKVEKFLPENEFVFIQPSSHKPGKSYPSEKFQELVDKFKDRIQFIQISPAKYGVMDNKIMQGIKCFVGDFTYRETLYFMTKSKFCVINHGGLSIGAAAQKTKTICMYSAMFHPRMTAYQSEKYLYVADENHQSCGTLDGNYAAFKEKFPNGCPKCWDLYCRYDNGKLLKAFEEML